MFQLPQVKRFLILLFAGLAGCTHITNAWSAAAIELNGAHVTNGAGIQLYIPRVVGSREWISPLLGWFDPGEGHSPYIADLFPCGGLLCKDKYAATMNLYVSRSKMVDLTEPGPPEQRLRHRVMQVLKAADVNRSRLGSALDDRESRALLETMKVVSLGDGLWAKLERRFKDGSLAGAVYMRVINREFTGYASFSLESAPLPKGVTLEALDKAFEAFVIGIKIEAVATIPTK